MRPTHAVIDLGAIRHNIFEVRKRVGWSRKILVAVKANAYGHGLVRVAQTCVDANVDMLGVAILGEAVRLRQAGIGCPILIFNNELPHSAEEIVRYDITSTVCTEGLAEALSEAALRLGRKTRVHLNVDTGMGRIGLRPEEATGFAERIARLNGLMIEGIYTHFPVADQEDKGFTVWQIKRFAKAVEEVQEKVGKIPIIHAANSAAVLKYPESYFDMVRPGIMIYGLEPFKGASELADLIPALTLKSKIAYLKDIQKGTSISYGRTFIAQRATRIATVPIGYGDGYNRLLSGCGEVLVHGRRAPVVGTICMDQIMVDVGGIARVQMGDEVVLIGRQGTERITAEEIAEKLGTINYEVTCWISERVPRVYNLNNSCHKVTKVSIKFRLRQMLEYLFRKLG